MSTIKAINVQHPSSATTNIVNDASGNVAAGANLYVPSGNVGIGTSTPSTGTLNRQLTINSGATSLAGIVLQNNATGTAYNDGTTINILNGTDFQIVNQEAGFMSFGTNNTERMRIDSSGNVGIGTSSPGSKLSVTSGSNEGIVTTNGTQTTKLFNSTSITAGALWVTSNHALSLGTNNAEQMRIDTNGNLLVRTTTAGGLLTIDSVSGGTTSTKLSVYGYGSGRGYGIEFRPNTDTGATPCRFLNAAGTEVGYISTSSSGATYSTTSDYRLKNSVAPLNTGLATVSALKPVTYKWNVDDSNGEGFIAHELHSVIPLAVQGEKDAVDDEGNIKPQGVDYSKIVVHLVAAIQELSAKNDALEARLAALEAK